MGKVHVTPPFVNFGPAVSALPRAFSFGGSVAVVWERFKEVRGFS